MFNKVEKPDPRFISKLTTKEALEYWIRLIVEGYKRLYRNMEWTECKAVEDYNSRYHENNNVCARFAKDLDPDTMLIGKTVSEMRNAFYDWDTEDNKFRSKLFKEAVWDIYKIGLGKSKVSGKVCRVFMQQADTDQKLDH
jgi:putative DNA primase/helicase